MRQTIKTFVSLVAKTLPFTEPIYEFGSYQVPGHEGFANLRPLFPEMPYVGCDSRKGPGVDRILDLHDIDLPAESVGTAICLDTLEHVEYPHRALEELHRILKPNGIVAISSHYFFPIHKHPHDYWRFTPEAFKSLLKPFEQSFSGFAGHALNPHTVIGVGVKGNIPEFSAVEANYRQWKRIQDKSVENIAMLMLPTLLLPAASRLRNKIRYLVNRDD
jgi:SAM-dependent methyltransferase